MWIFIHDKVEGIRSVVAGDDIERIAVFDRHPVEPVIQSIPELSLCIGHLIGHCVCKVVSKCPSHHNRVWLRTEYDTAVKRARRAAEMRRFESESDVLPNLRWVPSTAITPREEHKPFYDRIWPIGDPFFDDHMPGDEWGCQCDLEATDDPVTDNSDLDPKVAPPSPGLHGNPAQTGQLFSDDHPYFPDKCAGCAFNTSPLRLFRNKVKDCYNCANVVKAIKAASRQPVVEEYKRLKADPNYTDVKYDKKSGGLSAIHKEHKFDAVKGAFGIKRGDYERIAVDVLRTNGHQVILASEQAATGVKTPDGLLDGIVMDIKGIEGHGKWTIKNKFDSACSQQAQIAILYFHDKELFSNEKVRVGWNLFTSDLRGRAQSIERVYCIVDNDIIDFKP